MISNNASGDFRPQHNALDAQQHSHSHVEHDSGRIVHYPDHEPRTESETYKKSRNHLVHELGVGCWVCRVRAAEGAKLETHHCWVEWAMAGAVDWDKFGRIAHVLHNPQSGKRLSEQGFDWAKVAQDPSIFVDSVHNLLVLCDKHHRDGVDGIHSTPFPIWVMQGFVKEGFELLEKPSAGNA